MAVCVVNGCEKETEIREYCSSCYQRLRKAGTLPEAGEEPENIELPPIQRKSQPEEVRKMRSAHAIRSSYQGYLQNYQLCYSLEQRLYWRKKMVASLRQAEELGLTEEDLCLAGEV